MPRNFHFDSTTKRFEHWDKCFVVACTDRVIIMKVANTKIAFSEYKPVSVQVKFTRCMQGARIVNLNFSEGRIRATRFF